jgi:hypothetical protein
LIGLAQILGPPSATDSLGLDRYDVAHATLLLALRLVALSFAVNALGRSRARRLLIGSGRPSRRFTVRQFERASAGERLVAELGVLSIILVFQEVKSLLGTRLPIQTNCVLRRLPALGGGLTFASLPTATPNEYS